MRTGEDEARTAAAACARAQGRRPEGPCAASYAQVGPSLAPGATVSARVRGTRVPEHTPPGGARGWQVRGALRMAVARWADGEVRTIEGHDDVPHVKVFNGVVERLPRQRGRLWLSVWAPAARRTRRALTAGRCFQVNLVLHACLGGVRTAEAWRAATRGGSAYDAGGRDRDRTLTLGKVLGGRNGRARTRFRIASTWEGLRRRRHRHRLRVA